MGVTALTKTTWEFGLMRFITGLGVGALVATTGALVSEYAPPGKKNLVNAITYSGVPIGNLMAALLAILLLAVIGWRGMFWIGALPLVTLPSSRCRSRWPGFRLADACKRPRNIR
jgi:AAHS family benzoate transporter-like MFS transporter